MRERYGFVNAMVYLFAALAGLVIGGLLGYAIALSRRSALAEETAQLRSKVAALDATLVAERGAHDEKLALLDDARDRMTYEFRALANDILEENYADLRSRTRLTSANCSIRSKHDCRSSSRRSIRSTCRRARTAAHWRSR